MHCNLCRYWFNFNLNCPPSRSREATRKIFKSDRFLRLPFNNEYPAVNISFVNHEFSLRIIRGMGTSFPRNDFGIGKSSFLNHRPVITNARSPKKSRKSLHSMLVPILPWVSWVGNSNWTCHAITCSRTYSKLLKTSCFTCKGLLSSLNRQ